MDHIALLEVLKKENLSTYFILPLLGLDKYRFGGEKNLLNSYLSKDGKKVYVQLLEPLFIGTNLPEYKVAVGDEGTYYLEFDIPEKWASDITLYLEGKYSKMSELAKTRIRKGSTLPYNTLIGTSKRTDFRLLALENFSGLRETWTEIIYDSRDASSRNEIGEELLSIPSDKDFVQCTLSYVELNKETL